ncbi:MAG: VOC family protein [Pseudomonadota bacterium]
MTDLPKANISIVTLGVDDLARSTKFYTDLGWINTTASQESVTFLQGHAIVLGLYGRAALAEDAKVENTPAGFRGVTLALNLPTEEITDRYFEMALGVGAKEIKRPEKVFWGGYSGYFADPDGHLWEVAYNPFFTGGDHGQLELELKT